MGAVIAYPAPQSGPLIKTIYLGPWSGRPSAAAAGLGAVIVITDVPAGGQSFWVSNGANWKPYGGPLSAARKTGVTTGLQQMADQIIGQLGPLPAGLLVDAIFSLRFSLGRDVNTDAYGNVNVRLGAAGTTADTSLGIIPLGGTMTALGSTMSVGIETFTRMASNTGAQKLGTAGPSTSWNAAGSNNAVGSAIAVADVSSNPIYLSVSTTMGAATGTKPQTGYVELVIHP